MGVDANRGQQCIHAVEIVPKRDLSAKKKLYADMLAHYSDEFLQDSLKRGMGGLGVFYLYFYLPYLLWFAMK